MTPVPQKGQRQKQIDSTVKYFVKDLYPEALRGHSMSNEYNFFDEIYDSTKANVKRVSKREVESSLNRMNIRNWY